MTAYNTSDCRCGYCARCSPKDRRFQPGDRVHVYDGPCEWFALCDRVAEVMLDHPVLGQVPTCQRCADKVARLSA